ncbi:MFS transporter [Bacillus sp. FJAT-50079]|uniref:CynX/NimT family MFS transporter n=1 Tax=Bacillus sp. FJAT-50079 TaxID=2833577 RepID=UPI001BC8F4E2|nr:MFS transporter [Bacillus sp. FJAT-50079]MBS4206903.1 MFS transporter [Bacillus sp. FJAT-50079]
MNENMNVQTKELATKQVGLIIGIMFVAFNLRPAITAVGPLVGFIRTDLHLSNGVAGLFTTLPLLAFAAMSFLAPKIGRKFGNEQAIFLGLILLTIGIFLRSATYVSLLLFVGTAIAGIGIAICNVLLPAIVKQRFPNQVGLMTGVYTASLGAFAAIASGISIPIAVGFDFGWKNTLLTWAVLAIVALFVWLPQLRTGKQVVNETGAHSETSLLTSKLAWFVTFFLGFQSFLFYCVITWLPQILSEHGMNNATSGWMLFLLQLVGLPVSFLTPVIAAKIKTQRSLVIIIGILYLIAFVGLLSTKMFSLAILWVIFIGLAQGAGFSLALTFFVLRTSNSNQASGLSGMAQSLGYFLAALGPILLGILFDQTGSATAPVITFVIIAICMLLVGLRASSGMIKDNHS